jgi:hypothetical protein
MKAGFVSHGFCREQLSMVMKEVRQHFTTEEIKKAWVYNTGTRARPSYEFHGPGEHYDHNLRGADCAIGARAEGWSRLLERLERRKEEDERGSNA